jgi:predicted DNA-binding helix-hairpin-helix protein
MPAAGGIYRSVAGGRTVALLKVLQSTSCRGSCHYCTFRASHDVPRAQLGPDEMARHFLDLLRRGAVEGLFLSSGIDGPPDRAMARMVDTVELVRRSGFRGYVHLKILPGASDGAVERAVALADRVSINLEAPSAETLSRLSPGKRLDEDILAPLRVAARAAAEAGLRSGITTQFVVGAAGESDRELLQRASDLYREQLVRRCYFSPFSPPSAGPLAGVPAAPGIRAARLYEADFLLRSYGFAAAEIPFRTDGLLDPTTDPKTTWAEQRPELFPVEVSSASREELLRVPGIGPIGADRIVSARRTSKLRSPRDLARLGVRHRRASRFLTFDGRRFQGEQLELFGASPGAVSPATWPSPGTACPREAARASAGA